MNRKQARAIFAFQATITKACDQLEKKLEGSKELQYAQSYYLAHIRSSVGGTAYGSLSIKQANEVLGEEHLP